MAGKKGQKKRVWSDEEKLSICAQARVCGVSVAEVARRHAMNTNLIHKWLRDPRFASEDQAADLSVPAGAPVPGPIMPRPPRGSAPTALPD